MPITLSVAGTKTKFANAVVEAAFAQALAETPDQGEVRVSSAVAAVSKIANTLGLKDTVYRDCGNGATAVQVCYPESILVRVAEVLGCDSLAGSFRHDPVADARNEAEAWTVFRAEHAGLARLEFDLNKGKPWVAVVIGFHGQYRFSRTFLSGCESPDGKRIVFWVPTGFIEVGHGVQRTYFEARDGAVSQVTYGHFDRAFPGQVYSQRPATFEEVEARVDQLEFEGDRPVRPEHERFG